VNALAPDHVELDGALLNQKLGKSVRLEGGAYLVTIFAQNLHQVAVILGGHRRVGHFVVQILPQLGHVHQGRLTDGACVVARLEQLIEASAVEEVAAHGDVARDPRRVDVFQTYRTVGPGHVLHALRSIDN
jgi:hypothetical protein